MTCSACSSHVQKAVSKLDGIKEANVNLLTNSMQVEYDHNKVTSTDIIKAVEKAGYGASRLLEKKEDSKNRITIQDPSKELKKRFLISLLFLIPLMYIAMGHMVHLPLPTILLGSENALIFSFTQLLLTIPILYINRNYYQVGFKALKNRAPNMDSLIAIGSLAAFLYGIFAIYMIGFGLGHQQREIVETYRMSLYFESPGMILTLITLGKYLESKSKKKTTDAIEKLMNLTPKTTTILKDGKEITVATENVQKGDIVLIKPGERIPVDGKVVKGMSYVDQSAITGESIPVKKQEGDTVISATINQNGSFQFLAEKVGENTTISQIIALVEEASSSKAPISRLADKISGIFVPTVIGIAILAMIIWLILGYSFEFALSIGIAVLVISCPCALGLATPVSIMVATGKAAENGILIKEAESLEIAHKINCIVLDKTGTITEGKMEVASIQVAEGYTESQVLQIANLLEQHSEHPIAKAVLQKCKEKEIKKQEDLDYFETVTGKGVKGKIGEDWYFAGNSNWMQEMKIETTLLPKDNIATLVYIAKNTQIVGVLSIRDTIKENSKQAINEMQKLGIEVYMITGDQKEIAESIAKEVGIKHVIAEVLPQEKEKKIQELQWQGKKVAMVGDGINDSPAIMRADLGIAIGAGTDIAIDSADMILIKSDLQDVVNAVELSKATIRNIKMNLFWAFFYNTIGIPVAAGVFYPLFGWTLNPMIAAAAMSLSSVCVVTNALRLRRFSIKRQKTEKKEEIKMNVIIKIEGMACQNCVKHVKAALEQIEGIQQVQVSLEEKQATILVDKEVEEEEIKKVIEEAGYKVVKIEKNQ